MWINYLLLHIYITCINSKGCNWFINSIKILEYNIHFKVTNKAMDTQSCLYHLLIVYSFYSPKSFLFFLGTIYIINCMIFDFIIEFN